MLAPSCCLLLHCAVALKFASQDFQADREFVLEAVKQRGSALRWASHGIYRFQVSVLIASVWNVFSSILASKAHLIAVKNKLHLQHFPRHVAPLPGQVEELANQDLYLLL